MSTTFRVTSRTWLWPTARTMSWSPLAAAVGALLCAGILAGARGHDAQGALPILGVGVLAGAATVAVNDAARGLVHAVATPARTRLLRRLALLVPVGGVAIAALLLLGRAALRWTQPPLRVGAGGAALFALGVAAHCLALRRWPHHAADAAVVAACAWPLVALLFPTDVLPTAITMAWFEHPGTVLAVGLAATIVACRGCDA